MAADQTPSDPPLTDAPPDSAATRRRADGSVRLAILFLIVLGLLGLLGATGTAASAVDALLANPAQNCGGG